MANRFRMMLAIIPAVFIGAAGPSASHGLPEWLLGEWVPVEIRQDADGLYPSKEGEPKTWLAGQQLHVSGGFLILADDRCENPYVAFHRGLWSTPLHEFGAGNLESLGLASQDQPVDFMSFKCMHDLHKLHDQAGFSEQDDRGIPITWYAIIHSHTEIDLPFFGGSYVKFKKASPTT